MSLLSHQSAINPKKDFWAKAFNLSTLQISTLTADLIETDLLKANQVSTGYLLAGQIDTGDIAALNGLIENATIENLMFSTSQGLLVSTLEVDGGLGRFVSIITQEIELDNATINVINGDTLLLNGIPIATTDQLSSIQDWSIFPAYSTIYIANSNVNLGDTQFGINTAYIRNLQNSSISTSWIESGQGYISQLNTDNLAASNVLISTLFTNSLQTSSIQSQNAFLSTLNVSSINNLPQSNIQTSNWSLFPAISQVQMANNNIQNVGNYTGNNTVVSSLQAANTITFGGFPNPLPPFNFVPAGTAGGGTGDINTIGNINCVDVTCGDIECDNCEVGDSTTSLGDLNVYGANNPPLDNALFVEGGVEFDGGLIHGTAFGCLPVAGINTTRFSMTPAAGIVMITPIALSMNAGAVMNQAVGGAYSLAVGGVANLAAGTYMEIDSGLLKLINNTPIIFSANTGAGDPGGLNINTYTGNKSLSMDGLPFGIFENYKSGATYQISSGMSSIMLDTFNIPALGQWQIQNGFEFTLNSGNGKDANVDLYFAPVANPDFSYLAQGVFIPPITNILDKFKVTVGGAVGVSTITGSNLVIGSTITENFSTIGNSTFSSFTSSIFSSIVFEGGLNLYIDSTNASASFNATLQRGAFGASYLGSYLPSLQ
jgi:hypothetical protein